MFAGDPKPLDPKASITAFVPDPSCAWVVIYAGACTLIDCDKEKHDRLYVVPMIGWIHAVSDGVEFRPAVMTADGLVGDYLDIPDHYKFVAVLQDNESTLDMAHVLYRKKYGDTALLDTAISESLAN